MSINKINVKIMKIKAAAISTLICLTLFFSPKIQAKTIACPKCPSGCVPTVLVESYRPDLKEIRMCTPGCVFADDVVHLREGIKCRELPVTIVKPDPETREKPEKDVKKIRQTEVTAHRMIFSPTAMPVPRGQILANGYAAGLWEFLFGAHENFYAGISTLVPAAVFGLLGRVSAQFEIADGVHLGGGAFAGFMSFLIGRSPLMYAFGLNTAITFSSSDSRHYFNLGVTGVEAGMYSSSDGSARIFILPITIGYRFNFRKRWSFQSEFYVPIVPEKISQWKPYSPLPLMLLLGFRGHGDFIFGDFGLAYPISDWYYNKNGIWRYTPVGFPYFAIGFNW